LAVLRRRAVVVAKTRQRRAGHASGAVRSLSGGADLGLRRGTGRAGGDLRAAAHALLEPDGSPGGLDLGLNATRVGNVTVSFVRLGRDVQMDTAEAENYHVDLPITGGTVCRSGRLERVTSTPRRAAVFMPELSANIEWRAGCGQFCLMFPCEVLQQALETILDRPLSAPIAFAPAMDVAGGGGRAWADALRLVERQTRYPHGLLDHPLAARRSSSYAAIPSTRGRPRAWPGGSRSARAACRTASRAQSASPDAVPARRPPPGGTRRAALGRSAHHHGVPDRQPVGVRPPAGWRAPTGRSSARARPGPCAARRSACSRPRLEEPVPDGRCQQTPLRPPRRRPVLPAASGPAPALRAVRA
jgi:hypothetical protein